MAEINQHPSRIPFELIFPIYSNFKKLIKTRCGFSYKWEDNNGGEPIGVLEQWSIGLLKTSAKSDKGILSILIAVENRSHNPSRYTGELKIEN